MSHYQNDFYVDAHKKTLYPARVVLDIILNVIPKVESAIDLGCAVGSWLSVLKEKGVDDIIGLDGDWVNKDFLEIPLESFRSADLSKPVTLDKKYELAMSLEVAEHLPESSANNFIESLTNLSDFILFSAAIPFQGGTNHVNEQWPEYWELLFEKYGFVSVDIIRRQIWDDKEIPFWYKQNLILYVKKNRLSELAVQNNSTDYKAISLVHPEQFTCPKIAVKIIFYELKQRIKSLFRF